MVEDYPQKDALHEDQVIKGAQEDPSETIDDPLYGINRSTISLFSHLRWTVRTIL